MDATCCPADIAFPQDFQLLNHTREILEQTIRDICKEHSWRMPRTYCEKARQDYPNLSKSKKRTEKAIRKCIKKQLGYIRRDLGYIIGFIRNKGLKLDQAGYDLLNVLTTLYEQQLYMFENRTHSVPNKIVSIRQYWVRPIVRGKVHANTEFGVGKRAYGLNRIMAHLPETSFCVISVALLCMNLAKRLRSLCFDLFGFWFKNWLSSFVIPATT